MHSYDYSVVIPVYNNEATLPELLERTHAVFQRNGHSFEVICVNDGSTDGSWDVLTSFKNNSDFPLKLILFASNHGQHKALLCGMSFAKGQSCILMDADLQTPPEEIDKLIIRKKETKAAVVYGTPEQKHHHPARNVSSNALGWVLRNFGSYQAQGSSFKIIDQEIVSKIINTGFEYIFIDEILSWYTSNFEYVAVSHLEREKGKSGYKTAHLFKMAWQIIFNYTTLPLRIMTYLGLAIGVVCFFIGIYFIFLKIMYGSVLGFTAIIVSILFSTGVLMFSLGIIGEYLKNIYFTQLSKPPFTIKRIIE